LPIKAMIIGKPADNYEITAITLQPDNIQLTGPEAVLGDIKELTTATVTIDGITATINKQVNLDLSPELATLLGETVVTVRVGIKEKVITEKWDNIAVTIVNGETNLAYLPEPPEVSIEVSYPARMTNMIKDSRKALQATVDVDKLSPGRHLIPLKLKAEKGFSANNSIPQEITVDISPILSPDHPLKIKK